MYKLLENTTSVIRLSDGDTVPADANNVDGLAYLEWLAAGNVPEPAYTPTVQQTLEDIRVALQRAIDAKAAELQFPNGGNTLLLYAGFANPFQPVALTFAQWEASVWHEADVYRQNILLGLSPMITAEEAVAMIPAYPV